MRISAEGAEHTVQPATAGGGDDRIVEGEVGVRDLFGRLGAAASAAQPRQGVLQRCEIGGLDVLVPLGDQADGVRLDRLAGGVDVHRVVLG